MKMSFTTTLRRFRFTFATHVLRTELRRDSTLRNTWHVEIQMVALKDRDDTNTEYFTYPDLNKALNALSNAYADAIIIDAENTTP